MLEYDGTGFVGWQRQKAGRTVEGEMRAALLRILGEEVTLQAAGRTDAGAHALGQVVNFHTARPVDPARLRSALNALLPDDVAALTVEAVWEGFHARYSARRRRYRYVYLDRPVRPALGRSWCWHLPGPLDAGAMDTAARCLVGRHDWTSFCSAAEPEADRMRTMFAATVLRRECPLGRSVELELVAEGFLRGLARGIAGGLAEVGRGRRRPEWMAEVLTARDRSLAPRTAPARGLTLVEVLYEPPGSKDEIR